MEGLVWRHGVHLVRMEHGMCEWGVVGSKCLQVMPQVVWGDCG